MNEINIIAIVSQKGGAGKTTLAVNLSVAATAAGRKTILLDTDPQASATIWGDLRANADPEVRSSPPVRLPQEIERAQRRHATLVIIDTAAHADGGALVAARLADLVLIPCRPAMFDIVAIRASADIAKLTNTTPLVVLNAVPPTARKLPLEAREIIAAEGLPVAPVSIAQRSAFTRSINSGRAVTEFDPHGKAAAEVNALEAAIISLPAPFLTPARPGAA